MTDAALLDPADRHPPAAEAALAAAEVALGALPSSYRAFLEWSDGYSGAVGEQFAAFWPIADVVAGGYDVGPAFDLVLIGSNGGPTAFAYRRTGEFVSVPMDAGSTDQIRVLGATFPDLLTAIADGEGW